MNDIEILEEFIDRDKQIQEDYNVRATIQDKEIDAIENLLKERQADKDRINILRDRVQEEEDTIKSLTNIFANEKQEYLNRIKELEDEQKGYKDRIKELEEQVKMLDEAYTGAIKESKKWFNIAHQSIPKSLVKEKIEWLEDNILDNEYASGSDMDIAEYQVDILKRILGEKQ